MERGLGSIHWLIIGLYDVGVTQRELEMEVCSQFWRGTGFRTKVD